MAALHINSVSWVVKADAALQILIEVFYLVLVTLFLFVLLRGLG